MLFSMAMLSPVPVLRVFDTDLAFDFYLDFLGFDLVFEHRIESGFPLYARVSRDEAILDLSEHYNDGTPGSAVWIPVSDLESLTRDLNERLMTPSEVNIDPDAPGGPTANVIDPFGNILRFCQPYVAVNQ